MAPALSLTVLAAAFFLARGAADADANVSDANVSVVICKWGCYDEEDEACHMGLDQNGCAEIYGHVKWAQLCECVEASTGIVLDTGSAEAKGATASIYFSVPAFVVLFRESLEVVIVLAIIVQFLNKSKDDGLISESMFYKFRREVYAGASIGFLACMAVGIGFLILASMAFKLFEGDSELIFEFVMMMLTCLFLSFLALNFYKMIHTKEGHERKMRQRVQETIEATRQADTDGQAVFGRKHAFFVFAFTTGLREGMESIIFLVGVVSDLKDLSSLPLPIISALVLARLVGCCFFQGTKRMRVDWFMRASAFILLFISAGFFASAMHNLQELDAFGTWSPKAERPWQNQKVWDATGCCNDKTNRFFVLMRALVGWQDQATPVELFAYAIYWTLAIGLGFCLVRLAKKELEAKVKEWRRQDEEAALAKQEEAVADCANDAVDLDLKKDVEAVADCANDAVDLDLKKDVEGAADPERERGASDASTVVTSTEI